MASYIFPLLPFCFFYANYMWLSLLLHDYSLYIFLKFKTLCWFFDASWIFTKLCTLLQENILILPLPCKCEAKATILKIFEDSRIHSRVFNVFKYIILVNKLEMNEPTSFLIFKSFFCVLIKIDRPTGASVYLPNSFGIWNQIFIKPIYIHSKFLI